MSALLAQQVPMPAPLPPIPPIDPAIFQPHGPPVFAIVAVIVVLVAGVLLFPVVRAWARRLERGAAGPDEELRAEVDALRGRVAELEAVQHRVMELEERMDFSERLLTQRQAEALPRRGDV